MIIDLAETSVVYKGNEYLEVLDHWTREKSTRLHFDTALDATATYRSWDYRQAYVAHRAALYHLTDAERADLLRQEGDDERQTADFHVMVRATRDEWLDLSSSKSIWRITLVDSAGHTVLPSSVRADRTEDTELRAFYPYTTVFGQSYDIRFPRTLPDGSLLLSPGIDWFSLRFDGPLGHVELRWDVKET